MDPMPHPEFWKYPLVFSTRMRNYEKHQTFKMHIKTNGDYFLSSNLQSKLQTTLHKRPPAVSNPYFSLGDLTFILPFLIHRLNDKNEIYFLLKNFLPKDIQHKVFFDI